MVALCERFTLRSNEVRPVGLNQSAVRIQYDPRRFESRRSVLKAAGGLNLGGGVAHPEFIHAKPEREQMGAGSRATLIEKTF